MKDRASLVMWVMLGLHITGATALALVFMAPRHVWSPFAFALGYGAVVYLVMGRLPLLVAKWMPDVVSVSSRAMAAFAENGEHGYTFEAYGLCTRAADAKEDAGWTFPLRFFPNLPLLIETTAETWAEGGIPDDLHVRPCRVHIFANTFEDSALKSFQDNVERRREALDASAEAARAEHAARVRVPGNGAPPPEQALTPPVAGYAVLERLQAGTYATTWVHPTMLAAQQQASQYNAEEGVDVYEAHLVEVRMAHPDPVKLWAWCEPEPDPNQPARVLPHTFPSLRVPDDRSAPPPAPPPNDAA